MGLYNFKPRFVAPILAGTKCQTIRARRKHPDVPGNTMHLYTGLRQRGARRIACVECTWVSTISVGTDGVIFVDGEELDGRELEALARHDGFADFAEMLAYWRDGKRLPFEGQIFGWGPLR